MFQEEVRKRHRKKVGDRERVSMEKTHQKNDNAQIVSEESSQNFTYRGQTEKHFVWGEVSLDPNRYAIDNQRKKNALRLTLRYLQGQISKKSYCIARNFRQEFNFFAFVEAVFWRNKIPD